MVILGYGDAEVGVIFIVPNRGSMRLCIDGEITDARHTTFEIVHNAFNFVIPSAKIKDDKY